MTAPESIFTYGAPGLKFGDGAADEIGYDLAQLGARRALVITDPGVAATGLARRAPNWARSYPISSAAPSPNFNPGAP